MGKVEGASTEAEKAAREDAYAAYQAAVTLYTYEGTLIWSRINAFLVAHGLFLAAIFVLLTTDRETRLSFLFPSLAVLLSFVGLIVTGLWRAITQRGFRYHDEFLKRAEGIDQGHLTVYALPVHLSKPSKDLAFGLMPVRNAIYTAIRMFYLIYGATAVVGFLLAVGGGPGNQP